MKVSRQILSFLLFFCFFIQFSGVDSFSGETAAVDRKRNQLIGYMIDKQLPAMHFSNKIVDDNLAKAAFELYIKQLDYQKRFLLKKDVENLQSFALYIDDDLERGTVSLPETGFDILNERIAQVEKMVDDILNHGFETNTDESLETDPEKLTYVSTLADLKNLWHKILRAQVITRYLELEEEQKKAKEKKTDKDLWQEAMQKVAKRNKNFFHRLHQETLQDHYDRFFNAVTRAFDPHTNYIPPAGKEQFDINMRGSLEGIGALLREEDGFIKVARIIPGSASARQGRLQAEDIILQVAEGKDEPVDVTDMRLSDAVRLIRGPKGSEVRLTVRKADGGKDVIPITRDVVQIEETFVKSTIITRPDGIKIGYLIIPSFYRDFEKNGADGSRNSSDDTRREIEKLKTQKVDGIIIDLRNNGGGALVDAVEITGLFIDQGPVVQVKNKNEVERVLSDEKPGEVYDGPLVVLVNKFSASASEIVAGALQDYHRAVIVGDDHTHGKGTVQTVIDLNENIPLLHLHQYEDLGALKVMIQKFYRVTGSSTQYKGVEPDIVLPSLLQNIKSGERYLEYSLPWDSIAPVKYTSWAQSFNLDKLKARSAERVLHDPGLTAIKEEAKRADERSKDTVISINLAEMSKEREEAHLTREKVGAHYRKYRAEENIDEDAPPPEEGKDEWMKDVQDDPYVGEAANILVDTMNKLP
jgi:carboxyl-terminal processing protease